MSSRNPMNERYTLERKGGKSWKSAASAKPKKSAASSVITGTKKKTVNKATKREQKRQARDKAYEAERRYGDPPTQRFKNLRKLWIIFLVLSIVMVGLSFGASKLEGLPDWVPMVFLGGAYFCIILTLYIDLGKIKRERKAYAAKMMAAQGKEVRAQQKKLKAQQRKKEKEKLLEKENNVKEEPRSFTEKALASIKKLNPFKKE